MTADSPNSSPRRLLIVAGEASADAHAAAVLKELRQFCPDLIAYGVGGKRLKEAGMEVLVDSETLSVVGGTDWLDRFWEVLGGYRRIRRGIASRPPDAALLLDLPDFNLLLARRLKAKKIPVVYYISPQVWAWRQYRVKTIARVVSRLLVVFPFEEKFYQDRGVDAEFVGHPLVESFDSKTHTRTPDVIRGAPRIALLPGSRPSELRFHGELLRETKARLKQRYPDAEFKVPIASTLDAKAVCRSLGLQPEEAVPDQTRRVLDWADLALVASGTATLEAALVNVPFALFYRMSGFSWWAVQRLVHYKGFLGMPNLLSGREVVREFLQDRATVENLTEEAIRLIEEKNYRVGMIEGLQECRQRLGARGASVRVASVVKQTLEGKSASGSLGWAPVPAN